MSKCENCNREFPEEDLINYEGVLKVCRRCYHELDYQDKKITEEMNNHGFRSNREGGEKT